MGMISKETDNELAIMFKGIAASYRIDRDGVITDWRSPSASQPTQEELDEIINSGEFKKWKQKRQNNFDNTPIKRELERSDIESIRSLREWLCQQPDAPKWLKEHEEKAKKVRKKLKG